MTSTVPGSARSPSSADLVARVDRLAPAFAAVEHQVRHEGATATVLGVADAEGPIAVRAYSRRDDAVTTSSRFMIASVTKPLTAVALMRLVEAGALDLHRPIRELLPEFVPPAAAPGLPGGEHITAWHILTHTSGMPDLTAEEMTSQRPSAARILEWCCTRPLLAAPGTRYAYVSFPFYVLAELIRRISGESYPAYLQRHVLRPLGMEGTGFRVPLRERARVHDFGPGDVRRGLYLWAFARRELPGGGLWSRADDLLRFGRAMLRGGELDGVRILAPSSVAEMTRDHTAGILDAESGQEPRYGLAWNCSALVPGMPGTPGVFDHGGSTGVRLWIDPGAGLVIVYLQNRWGINRRYSIPAIQAVYRALGLPAGTLQAGPSDVTS